MWIKCLDLCQMVINIECHICLLFLHALEFLGRDALNFVDLESYMPKFVGQPLWLISKNNSFWNVNGN